MLPYMRGETALHELESTGAGKIKHVVFIVQENRSLDNVFMNYPGADTVTSGKDFNGRTIRLRPVSLGLKYQIDHSSTAMFVACDGKQVMPGIDCRMDGFNKEVHFGVLKTISTSTFRARNRSRTGTWPAKACLEITRFNRSSTRATSRINISSPRRRLRA